MAEERELRRLAINQSMTKPLMVLGCDRRLLLTSSLGCVYVGFNLGLTRGHFGILLLAIVCWVAIRSGLKRMGKEDPLMLDVFQRSTGYSDGGGASKFFFPASGGIFSKIPSQTKKRWL